MTPTGRACRDAQLAQHYKNPVLSGIDSSLPAQSLCSCGLNMPALCHWGINLLRGEFLAVPLVTHLAVLWHSWELSCNRSAGKQRGESAEGERTTNPLIPNWMLIVQPGGEGSVACERERLIGDLQWQGQRQPFLLLELEFSESFAFAAGLSWFKGYRTHVRSIEKDIIFCK